VILLHPWAVQSNCEDFSSDSFQAINSSHVENSLTAVSVEFTVPFTDRFAVQNYSSHPFLK